MRVLAMVAVLAAIVAGVPGYPIWALVAIVLMGYELQVTLKRDPHRHRRRR